MGFRGSPDYLEFTRFQCFIMKCEKTCSYLTSNKILMPLTAVINIITALLLLAAGAVIFVICSKYDTFVGNSYFVLPKFVITTAGVMIFAAVLGIYGMKSGKYELVLSYVVLLATLSIFQTIITIFAFDSSELRNYNKEISSEMYNIFQSYNSENYYSWETASWDYLQTELNCCGFENKYDWGNKNLSIPISCCTQCINGVSPFECNIRNSNYVGCKDALTWLLADSAFAIGVTAAVVTSLQGIIVILAAVIAYRLKSPDEVQSENKGILDSPADQASRTARWNTNHSQYHTISGENIDEADSTNVNTV